MTRLSDALERASKGDSSASVAAPLAGQPTRGPLSDVPRAWDFDVEKAIDGGLTGEPITGTGRPEGPRDVNVDVPDALSSVGANDKLVVGPAPNQVLVEQYRRLAAALHNAQLRDNVRTVMIASAVEAEGKTLTATNLALILSHSYQRRVLLVDADLRRPNVHEMFRLKNRIGLGETLKQTLPDGKLPVHRVSPTLWVMTAGRPNSDPMSVLISETMQQFLIDAAEQFDWVIIDTPPVALLPDAKLLAEMIDRALIVVRANRTPYPLVSRAIEAIGPGRVLGAVLNRAERAEVAVGYGYYSYSYDYARPRPVEPRRTFFGFGRRQKS